MKCERVVRGTKVNLNLFRVSEGTTFILKLFMFLHFPSQENVTHGKQKVAMAATMSIVNT